MISYGKFFSQITLNSKKACLNPFRKEEQPMAAGVDFESFSDVLKHPIRRKIVLTLYSSKGSTYMDLINAAEVANTGKFNYHLKLLADLIQKDPTGKYVLTEKGLLAAQFLQKFPEKKIQPTTMRMADAALIGLAGFTLIAANPLLWIGLLLQVQKMTVPFFVMLVFPLTALLYSLFVPSTVMWLLSVRRSHSHEMYDLLKGPLVAFILLLTFLIIMFFTRFDLVATIKTPLIIYSQYHTSQTWTAISLALAFVQGLVFSFLGVSLVELASRIRKRHRG